MKICSKCKTEKTLEDFNKNLKTKDNLSAYCKICIREAARKNYSENRDKHISASKTSNAKKLEIISSIKRKQCCVKCGYNKCVAALDYHHLDPNIKTESISKMVTQNKSKEDLLVEIEKCILLCSNCHREFHYMERKEGLDINNF